jgi:nucleoside-diphosphate-sugar epimerase
MPVSFPAPLPRMAPADRFVATGASGFVGRELARALGGRLQPVHLGIDGWQERLARAEWRNAVVFHLAARVHRRDDVDEAAYERDNVEKTLAVAEAAAAGGARRIVFASTIKVMGEESAARALRAGDPPRPGDAYARSKWRAEQRLIECSVRTGIEVVIVRVPLVIGPAAMGHLPALLGLADSGWPLPFAAVDNRRTFISREDLVALLVRCAEAPVQGRTLLAGDPDALSTPRLLRVLRAALGRPARLFPVPVAALEAAAHLGGMQDKMRRLTRSLEADVSETMRDAGWRPARPIDDALREMAAAWRAAA